MKDFRDYDLSGHNTFGIACRAKRFIEYDNEEELARLLSTERLAENKLLHIGGGSNLLFMNDFDGTVLHSGIKTTEKVSEDEDSVTLRVGSGVVWDDFVAYCVNEGFYGAENLSLIPGETGASAVQNIGAYGVEAKDIIETVETVNLRNGERRIFSNDECHYGYRSSTFKHELKGQYAVTHIIYRLSKEPCFHLDYGNIRSRLEAEGMEVSLHNLRETIIKIRQEKLPDPKVTGNAGSFFMNPVVTEKKFESLIKAYPQMPHYPAPQNRIKIPAGWLIESCGWKGKSLGKAGVHEHQALVLVNRGGAKGEDIMRLAEAVCKSVRDKFGIEISPEVNVIL